MNFKFSNERISRGFSLIELMVVLGVVGLLMAFAAPNLFSLITSNSLTGEGVVLRNQLTLAQQEALTKSSDIEVRFFKYTDSAAASTEDKFVGYQLFRYRTNKELEALGGNINSENEMVQFSEFFRIKAPVAIHEDLSTLINGKGSDSTRNDRKYGFDSPREGFAEAPTGVGGKKEKTEYVSFRFRPDGSTDLPYKSGDDTWYITLVQGEGALQTQDPPNYVCLQVNPYNGQVTEFRP